ncbi:MAG TPA: hypothetical protein VK395_19605 [Gemmataceae bacterium]|nr:hypothetical protein [Gemmataceae bacterium]
MIVQYIVGALFILWSLAQTRMLLVYLGIVPSSLGIVGSPMLVYSAGLAVIVNPIRAALCFSVPWPMLLPALSATLMISPLASALAYFGVFGHHIAHAAHPELSILTEKGRAYALQPA